jgi:hypothetical protein
MKTLNTVTKMIAFSLLTVTLASANKPTNFSPTPDNLAYFKTIYSTMTTAQLQKEVELRSLSGELSFNMGLELIKRWTKSS